jgi:hypothetical protein
MQIIQNKKKKVRLIDKGLCIDIDMRFMRFEQLRLVKFPQFSLPSNFSGLKYDLPQQFRYNILSRFG